MIGLSGNQAAEPRVFAHDAKAIVIGAINTDQNVVSFELTSGGSSYLLTDIGSTIAVGSGNATVKIEDIKWDGTSTPQAGTITEISLVSPGSGYLINGSENLGAVSGVGEGATIKILNIDIPGTSQRGCAIYNGNSSAADITVVMEGRIPVALEQNYAGIEFKSVQPGTMVGNTTPVLVKRVLNSASNLLAMF